LRYEAEFIGNHDSTQPRISAFSCSLLNSITQHALLRHTICCLIETVLLSDVLCLYIPRFLDLSQIARFREAPPDDNRCGTMTTQDPNNVGWVSEPTTRGTSSLAYTCISTTIICTWSALHLNVSGEGLSAGRVLFYKIITFVAAIIAPEWFVAVAVSECFTAHRLSRIITEILPVRT
jgi:hypothetical protein